VIVEETVVYDDGPSLLDVVEAIVVAEVISDMFD
jgi:hypothetical protein